jgi:hypothetical protein
MALARAAAAQVPTVPILLKNTSRFFEKDCQLHSLASVMSSSWGNWDDFITKMYYTFKKSVV